MLKKSISMLLAGIILVSLCSCEKDAGTKTMDKTETNRTEQNEPNAPNVNPSNPDLPFSVKVSDILYETDTPEEEKPETETNQPNNTKPDNTIITKPEQLQENTTATTTTTPEPKETAIEKMKNSGNIILETNNNFFLKLPNDWKDKYVVVADENNFIQIYHKATYETKGMEGCGNLFTIMKYSNSKLTEQQVWYENKMNVPYRYLLSNDTGTYLFMFPSDVQFDVSNETTAHEYQKMSSEISKIEAYDTTGNLIKNEYTDDTQYHYVNVKYNSEWLRDYKNSEDFIKSFDIPSDSKKSITMYDGSSVYVWMINDSLYPDQKINGKTVAQISFIILNNSSETIDPSILGIKILDKSGTEYGVVSKDEWGYLNAGIAPGATIMAHLYIDQTSHDNISRKNIVLSVPTNDNTEKTEDIQDMDTNLDYAICVDGVVYYNTGIKSESTSERNTSGKIESMVSMPTIPTENNSSNFGIGYEYNISSNGTISVHIADNWWVFAPIQETISNPESAG